MISKKICEQLLDNSLTYHKNYVSGTYKGYDITMDYKTSAYIVYIHATCDNPAGQAQFESFLKEHEGSAQYLSKAELKEHVVKLRIVDPKQKKIIPSVLNDTINPIITQLLGCKFYTGCINCGDSQKVVDCYEISGYHHYLCEECIAKIEQDFIDKQEQLKAEAGNPILGTVGAVLGSLLGVIAWVILYSNHLLAWMAGLAIIMLAYKGYEILGGRIDKKGFVISAIVIGVMIFLANHLAWAWSALDAAKLEGYSIGEILLLWKILDKANATTRYFIDLFVGYALTFVLGFRIMIRTYKNSIGAYSIKKC